MYLFRNVCWNEKFKSVNTMFKQLFTVIMVIAVDNNVVPILKTNL